MSALRTASVWLVAIILVLIATGFFLSISAAQMTGDESGQVVLKRSVAEITDLDQTMPHIEQDLDEISEEDGEDTVLVPGFPIAVELTAEEARTLRGSDLRDRILDDSAAALYEDGSSAWTETDPDAIQDIDRLSAAGFINLGLSLIQDSMNTVFFIFAVFLGIMTLAMVAILLIVLPREARLLVLALVVLGSSLPSLAAAVGLRFAFRTLETDTDEFVNGMLDIGADSMWIPIRNFLTLTVLGGALLLIGTIHVWWEGRTVRNQGHLADSGY